ncbi:MAG: UvrD-helicase domain-containing protein [Bacteroidales bacterium]|nr:UvrD-helicase domain-containing protein [Bacteroidales bacterium]
MGEGTLTIYSASAGSGKTYKLTGKYLNYLFSSRYGYRKILAVTFTNKATAEMKSRILDQLYNLATGEKSEYLPDLLKDTHKTEETIRTEAKEILFSILHDFSRFSVCTIDSFFQKILRAFTREAGLNSGFSIELDYSTILSAAVDDMIASSVDDPELTNWLSHFAMSNLEEEKSWNLKEEIMELAGELFKEKFKILSAEERSNLENKEFLLNYIKKIKSFSYSFVAKMLEFGKKCEKIYNDYGLSDEMFYYRSRGVPGYIRSLAGGKIIKPGNKVREIEKDPPRWSTGPLSPQLNDAIKGGLDRTLKETLKFYDDNILSYNSATTILSNIYALGILSDVLRKVRQVTASENTFLLADAGELLSAITGKDQSPFIYEKIGNRFENFMIDEFQDTSLLQWNNFESLINNSMSEGFDNLVVGDVKQSIYRWRNSDWQILGKMKAELIDHKRFLSEPLTTNWRSRSDIIRFNNTLFSVIPEQIDELLAGDSVPVSFKELYAEAVQGNPGKSDGGYVRLEFIKDERDNQEEENKRKRKRVTKKWNELVLEKLPYVIETLQDKGFNSSDIGIIVREGKEGEAVLNSLVDYSNNCPAEKRNRYNYNIFSNDSLLLSNSHAISFIIAVIRVLDNPSDMISKAQMLRFYLLATGVKNADSVPLFSNILDSGTHGYFPQGYDQFLENVRNLPLFEATENIISFFGIGKYSWNVAYLNTFQDWIINFAGGKNADIQTFLEWWETTGRTKSVVLPAHQDAARVFTIHKSKGLEFKAVILPFLSWNLNHKPSQQPVMWVKPAEPPFNELGIVPVRYKADLVETIFADSYRKEKSSAYLDNINLLYVAMTRAKDVIFAYTPDSPGSYNEIAEVLKNAVNTDKNPAGESGINLKSKFNEGKNVFEFGEIPDYPRQPAESESIISLNYPVSHKIESLRLKLHGENYFSPEDKAAREKINYGRLMHEVFESINSADDIPLAVRRLTLTGKIHTSESASLEKRLNSLIKAPPVSDWFKPGNIVMAEAEILLPTGNSRRPDRVIFRKDKTIIIDFKFGEENPGHSDQVNQYRNLLLEMGYSNIEGYIWYIDKNKILSA